MPKIIKHDNYDREGPGHDDKLIAIVPVWTQEAELMLKALVVTCSAQGDWYYSRVSDEYVLKKFVP